MTPLHETKSWNSRILPQWLFPASVPGGMCFRRLSCTSETEQEEGGALDPAAQRLARIRSTEAPQTKTALFEEEEEACSVPALESHDDFDSASRFYLLHLTRTGIPPDVQKDVGQTRN